MWLMDYAFICSSSSLSGCTIDSTTGSIRTIAWRLIWSAKGLRRFRPHSFLTLDNESLQYVHSRSSWTGSFEAEAGAHREICAVFHWYYFVLKDTIIFIFWWEVQKYKWVRNTKLSSEEPPRQYCAAVLWYDTGSFSNSS